MEKESVRLAIRLKDDTVWKTANLLGQDVPYSSAATVVNRGVGLRGRPVDETVMLYRLSNALETIIANPAHELDAPFFNYLKSQLGSSEDIHMPAMPSSEAEKKATDAFLELWPQDRLLAAICANHLLVNANIGLFGIYPEQLGEMEKAMSESRKAAETFVHDDAVELIPGGLTRVRMSKRTWIAGSKAWTGSSSPATSVA